MTSEQADEIIRIFNDLNEGLSGAMMIQTILLIAILVAIIFKR
jgi:hypothetical protein